VQAALAAGGRRPRLSQARPPRGLYDLRCQNRARHAASTHFLQWQLGSGGGLRQWRL